VLTRGLDQFVTRDWAAVRASKDRYWGDRIARLGPLEGLRIADELRRQALQCDPHWPDPEHRREDLLAHARLTALFRRATAVRRS
jgi:hypothetical protein